MPRKVDHHQRRLLLADALMRVAAQHGLVDVSLRHVAAEAGVTAGMVQHYFRTKDEMMVFALDAVRERVRQRLVADPAPAEPARAEPRLAVRALLAQMLPLDRTRELEAHVGLAFHAYAAVKPAMAEHLHAGTAAMQAMLADRVRAAQERDPALARIEPGPAGTALLSLVEGLALHVLGGHLSAEHALGVLDAHLTLVLGPER